MSGAYNMLYPKGGYILSNWVLSPNEILLMWVLQMDYRGCQLEFDKGKLGKILRLQLALAIALNPKPPVALRKLHIYGGVIVAS